MASSINVFNSFKLSLILALLRFSMIGFDAWRRNFEKSVEFISQLQEYILKVRKINVTPTYFSAIFWSAFFAHFYLKLNTCDLWWRKIRQKSYKFSNSGLSRVLRRMRAFVSTFVYDNRGIVMSVGKRSTILNTPQPSN